MFIPNCFGYYNSQIADCQRQDDSKCLLCKDFPEILGGFHNLEEAKDYLFDLRKTGNVYFTAKGYEINAKILQKAVEVTYIKNAEKEIATLKDKLHRRNALVTDLRGQIKLLFAACEEALFTEEMLMEKQSCFRSQKVVNQLKEAIKKVKERQPLIVM